MTEILKEVRDAAYLGSHFYSEGIRQLDNVVYDEMLYKTAILASMVGQFAVLAAGVPGGGKSEMAFNAYKLIEGIKEEDVAFLPSSMTMTEDQVVGGKLTSQKIHSQTDAESSSKTWVETSVVEIDGLIKPETKGLVIDEITRMNPYVLNSLLRLIENKTINTTAGHVSLEDLIYIVATMNPGESRESSLQLSSAMVSRYPVGVIVGNEISQKHQVHIFEQNMPDVSKMKPIITEKELAIVRNGVSRVATSEATKNTAVQWISDAKDQLVRVLPHSAEGSRVIAQVGKVARIMTLMRNEISVDPRIDLEMAIKFYLGSRIGAQWRDIKSAPDLITAITKASYPNSNEAIKREASDKIQDILRST